MKLPNAHLATVEREKITGYLLNTAHPDNGGKAAFFHAQGFKPSDWEMMADAFRKLAVNDDVTEAVESRHGRKYIVDGRIETPNGKMRVVRTIWIIDRGLDAPRLVTAYPREE